MTTLSFDPSGAVPMTSEPVRFTESNGAGVWFVHWRNLSPFEQGYVEALFASFRRVDIGHWTDKAAKTVLRFDKLAPEALAAILADCGLMAIHYDGPAEVAGRQFWLERQRGDYPLSFPILTVSLGDDGKVYLRPVNETPKTEQVAGDELKLEVKG